MSDTAASTAKSAHQHLREELLRAEKVGGETGKAARKVMQVLFPHMVMEERYAMPALRVLPILALGVPPAPEATPDLERILKSSEGLKAELPTMLEEHRRIVEALGHFMRCSAEEQHPGWAQFATKLIAHVQEEEEILYPAAILVGQYLKFVLGRAESV